MGGAHVFVGADFLAFVRADVDDAPGRDAVFGALLGDVDHVLGILLEQEGHDAFVDGQHACDHAHGGGLEGVDAGIGQAEEAKALGLQLAQGFQVGAAGAHGDVHEIQPGQVQRLAGAGQEGRQVGRVVDGQVLHVAQALLGAGRIQ